MDPVKRADTTPLPSVPVEPPKAAMADRMGALVDVFKNAGQALVVGAKIVGAKIINADNSANYEELDKSLDAAFHRFEQVVTKSKIDRPAPETQERLQQAVRGLDLEVSSEVRQAALKNLTSKHWQRLASDDGVQIRPFATQQTASALSGRVKAK